MKVLVLCGGRSAEREVSCVSAQAVLKHLGRHAPVFVWIAPDGRWFHQADVRAFLAHPHPEKFRFARVPARLEPGLRPALKAGGKRIFVDAVFPVLHGPFGEDGTLQGLLEMIGLPYVGAGVLGSSVGMDKAVSKLLSLQAGLPILPYSVLEKGVACKDPLRPMGGSGRLPSRMRLPVFVKPARMGSSVGVYKVKKASELAKAVRKAFRFDTTVIIEQGVEAREIECAVLGGGPDVRASKAVGEIRPNAEFYSYEAKYLDPNGARLMIPAELGRAASEEVRCLSVQAFRALGGYGLARVDFLLDKRTGKLWFNEVNTLPGFTSISMYPKLWGASGVSFEKLVDKLLKLAVVRHREQVRLRITRD
ncbi:MAG: D-alanine--D-alanine ligase family protein [Elusimicrobiota bacterium]|jgi:D-alanine-D-alanine ligase